ncbi:MAG: hypothetical protein U0Y68_23710 [Blastocatellia bacterium]
MAEIEISSGLRRRASFRFSNMHCVTGIAADYRVLDLDNTRAQLSGEQ